MLEGMWVCLIDEENVMLFFITLERKVGVIETSIECVGSDVAEEGGGKSRVVALNPIFSSRSGPSNARAQPTAFNQLYGARARAGGQASKVMEEYQATTNSGAIFFGT